MSDAPAVFTAGDARMVVDGDDGARISSFSLHGEELLHTGSGGGYGYGSLVMAPFAGRIRDARARHGDHCIEVAAQPDDGHGLHGLVHSRPWERIADDRWRVDVEAADPGHDGPVDGWFAALRIEQHLTLTPDALSMRLTVTADEPAPVTVGWHPWFRRTIAGRSVAVDLPARAMLRRDAAGIATTQRIPVPGQPWDDAFVDLDGPVTLDWATPQERGRDQPPGLRLTIDSDGPVVVVFTGRDHAVCVEPQSGPPDEVNLPNPRLVTPAAPLHLSSTWRWS
jgi:aldose 1-epimerase